MKREELASQLRQPYRDERVGGLEKVNLEGLENIWFVVPPPPPETLPQGLPARSIAKAIQIIEQLPRVGNASALDRLSAFLFVRREAVQSSRMEGTWSTLEHILTPGSLFDANEGNWERASVLGYAHALENEFGAAFKKREAIFNRRLVCRLHSEVVSKDPTYRGIPGKIRESVVFIGGLLRKEDSIYNPTPPRHVSRCLEQVLRWHSNQSVVELGNAGMGLPLPVRMAIGHAHFEAVHPFADGNGRVGRMLMTLQMAAHGVMPVYLSGYIEAQKKSYIESLQQAQKKLRYGPIVEFVCEAIASSFEEMNATKEALRQLPDIWCSRGAFRSGSAASRALAEIVIHPIFTVNQIQSLLKVSRPAANHAVAQLVQAGIVRERTGQERRRIFAAEEVLELLSRKHSEPPSVAIDRARQLLSRRS
jgi:Fic family protein